MKRTKASARVSITLEIPVLDVWGGDCPLEQVYRQAARSALDALRDKLPAGTTIIGEARVVAVLAEQERT